MSLKLVEPDQSRLVPSMKKLSICKNRSVIGNLLQFLLMLQNMRSMIGKSWILRIYTGQTGSSLLCRSICHLLEELPEHTVTYSTESSYFCS